MKIFLTGGTGFIGSHFLRQALAAGHQVTALRRSPASRPRIPLEPEPVWLDREMPDTGTEHITGHDVFVHLAAAGVSPQKADWATLFRVNVTESLALWLRAAEAGVPRFVICGSCFEFGEAGERYEFIPPDAPLEPTTAYAASKAAATMAAVALACERNLRMIVVRPFHTFGEGQHGTNFWPSLRRAAEAGENFAMTRGEQVRDFIPVTDVTRQILDVTVSQSLRAGEPLCINIGTGIGTRLRDFAEHWWRYWKAKGELKVGALPDRSREPARYVADISKVS